LKTGNFKLTTENCKLDPQHPNPQNVCPALQFFFIDFQPIIKTSKKYLQIHLQQAQLLLPLHPATEDTVAFKKWIRDSKEGKRHRIYFKINLPETKRSLPLQPRSEETGCRLKDW